MPSSLPPAVAFFTLHHPLWTEAPGAAATVGVPVDATTRAATPDHVCSRRQEVQAPARSIAWLGLHVAGRPTGPNGCASPTGQAHRRRYGTGSPRHSCRADPAPAGPR